MKKNLEMLESSEKLIEKHNVSIEELKNNLALEFSKKIRIEKHIKNKFKEVEVEVDEEYKDLYYKIDKYLENISELSINDYYEGLDILIKKYGRKASDLEQDKENKNNIYCIRGNKVLCCKHHEYFIDYYKKVISADELLQNLNEKYGVENDGYIWCNNCGQELNLAEYETIEGFTGSGARLVTHELIEEEEEYVSSTGSELLESIKHILIEGDNKSIKDDNSLNLVKVIDVILDFMGLKLSQEDNIKLFKSCELLNNTNIKSKEIWTESAKKQKKKISAKALEVAYNNYKLRNIILYTTANLFVYVQSAIPTFIVKKTHSKCVASLAGYPLDKENAFKGIDYIACILESLRETGNDWASLKKVKIKENLVKIIDQLLKDETIKYRYTLKRQYDSKQKENENEFKKEVYVWNEFKPLLNDFKVDLDTLSKPRISKDKSSFDNLEYLTKKEQQLSLKLIELINKFVNSSKVENIKFDPTPLDNACCLQEMKNNNYLSYFAKKDEDINHIVNILEYIYQEKRNIRENINSNEIFIKTQPLKYFESFRRIIEDNENIDDEEIKNYFLLFINEGPHKGSRYMFDNNGVCQLSGVNKKELLIRKFTIDEYNELKQFNKKEKEFNSQ